MIETRQCSFRGQVFHVLSSDTDGLARRTQTHQYPKRDEPFTEDLGAGTVIWTFEAFVPWDRREAFERACGQPGPGALVHALDGERQVVCRQCQRRIGAQQLGVATYNLVFVAAGANRFPEDRPRQSEAVDASAVDARAAAQASAIERMSAAGRPPQWAIASLGSTVGSLAQVVRTASSWLASAESLASLDVARAALEQLPSAVLGVPSDLVPRVADVLRRLARLSADPRAKLRALGRLLEFGSDLQPIAPTTASRVAQGAQRDALVHLVRRMGAIEVAHTASRTALPSYEASVAMREQVQAALGPEIDYAGDTGDDAVLGALQTLQVATVEDLRVRGTELAHVRTTALASTLPALVLAYRLYGDSGRDGELVARNAIRHPTFVPVGQAIEYLSRTA